MTKRNARVVESPSAVTPRTPASCCPLPPGVGSLPPISDVTPEEVVERFVRLAKALADPVRVRMLGFMAIGADCCRPGGDSGAVAGSSLASGTGSRTTAGEKSAAAAPRGVCVCELQERYGLGQSRVSYHLKVLKEAGLVREERRGKWSFYSLDEGVARELLERLRDELRL